MSDASRPGIALDHLVITAPTLQSGADAVAQALGVQLEAGGEHPRMGTHNRLLRLDGTAYLEVIAIDPAAPPPGRPRWFGLDSRPEAGRDQPPAALSRLSTWVLRTPDIKAVSGSSTEELGEILSMSRGNLNWLISVPEDGAPVMGGVAPTLIQWQAEPHPATRLQDQGLALVKLELFHPASARVSRLLLSLGFDDPQVVPLGCSDRAPYLVAHIDTPKGLRTLSFPGVSESVS